MACASSGDGLRGHAVRLRALVGFEVSGEDLEDSAGGTFVAAVVPAGVGGSAYRPVTRWDFGRPG
jgi:UDP:flavonoid glycosyltransferase YjiC (YdhE family)